jgi:GT2 family glycosyltransferase
VASVSVVLITRDRPALLLEAIESIGRQSHLEMELVLVRDGGVPLDDAARAALDRLEFPAIVLEHDDDEGAARSRNRGLTRARGDAIAFLDDDDLWDPGHVKQLADALDRDGEAMVVYSDARILHVETAAERVLAVEFAPDVFVRDGFIPPSAMIARRAAFERFGGFDPEFTYSEDWEWLIRVTRGGGKIARVRGASATIRIHPGGLSQLKPERLAERQRCLDLMSARYGLAPIQPKTFWEVTETLCPGTSASTR